MERSGAFIVGNPTLAFIATPQARAGLEIRVNFGVFAGREATSAEIDDLADSLLPEIGVPEPAPVRVPRAARPTVRPTQHDAEDRASDGRPW